MAAKAKCIICRCTESRACDGGCSWASIDPPVCDRCAGEMPWQVAKDGDRKKGQHVTYFVTGPGPNGYRDAFDIVDRAEAMELAKFLNGAYAAGRRYGMNFETILTPKQRAGQWRTVRPRKPKGGSA